MMAGTLNPWLKAQSDDLPGQLGHDFTKGGLPVRHLRRIAEVCKSVGSRLMVAYVPFCGVVSRRYVPSLVDLGMDRTTAEATADLVQAEEAGVPQYWRYDTHPRPAGYATLARRIHRALRGEAQ